MEGAPPSVDTTSPAGCSLGGYTLWPASWQTSTSGTYTATIDLTGNGLSGNGSWSVYLFNGYGGSAGVQYDASWTISGLCIDGGGSGPGEVTARPTSMATARDGLGPSCSSATSAACLQADLNGDGIVTTSDMLVFLAPSARSRVIIASNESKSPGLAVGAFSYPGQDLNPHGPFGPTG